jgi:UTP:GlnB (protein PII) uridylyltransferase
MKRFYQTVRRVAELNEMLLQLFDEAILGNTAMDVRRISDESSCAAASSMRWTPSCSAGILPPSCDSSTR